MRGALSLAAEGARMLRLSPWVGNGEPQLLVVVASARGMVVE